MGFHGSKYTWSNKRDSDEFINERLDWAIATPRWCEKFPNAVVEVLPVSNSDHKPLLPTFDAEYRMPSQLLRYEAKWNLDEECHLVIQHSWNEGEIGRDQMGAVLQNLVRCKASLNAWSRLKFGGTTRTINSQSKRLERLQREEQPGTLATIREVQGELNKLLEMEYVKWWQRAKRNWFKDGDRNTQFFHAWANQHRRSNFIGSIKNLDGHLWN